MKKTAAAVILVLVLLFPACDVHCMAVSLISDEGVRMVLFEDIIVEPDADEDTVCIMGNASVGHGLTGDLVVFFGNAVIHSHVEGNVVVFFGQTAISEGASVSGDLVTMGPLMSKGEVYGNTIRIFPYEVDININRLISIRIFLTVMFSFLSFAAGAAIYAIFGGRFGKTVIRTADTAWKNLAAGFIAYVLLLLLLPFLFITIIYPVFFFAVLAAARVFAGFYTGRTLLGSAKSGLSRVFSLLTGITTITLIQVLLLSLMQNGQAIVYGIMYLIFQMIIHSFGIGLLIGIRK